MEGDCENMDPYSELGISPGASDEEIKSAYRNLAKQYHPDANPQDEQAAEKMNRINTAYRMLREGITYDFDLDEDWYREQAEMRARESEVELRRKTGLFYNPLFRRIVVIGIAVCMVVGGILSSFYSAFWADTADHSAAVEPVGKDSVQAAEDYHQKYLDKNPNGYCHIPRSYFTLQETEKQQNIKKRGE